MCIHGDFEIFGWKHLDESTAVVELELELGER